MQSPLRILIDRLMKASLILIGCVGASVVTADTIALIGTGNVAGALGPQFAKQGYTIIYGSREPDRADVRELLAQTGPNASVASQAQAAAAADIVVIAVPGAVAVDVTRSLGNLAGKIILDPTNITAAHEDGFRIHAVATSNAELIQAAAPGAHVVKAFNTLNYRTMVDPASAGGPVTIPIAGNDADAKQRISALAEGKGFEVIDVGPLRFAGTLEEMLVIWVNARQLGTPYNYHLVRQPTP
jgi:predicted dinucleotide-binding enzyme